VREVVQVSSLIISLIVMALISLRVYRRDGNWRVWLPMTLNVLLTIAYYTMVFTNHNSGSLGDFSAALRLETVLTFLAYALYMPRSFRRNV
jgi:hypothetical protein